MLASFTVRFNVAALSQPAALVKCAVWLPDAVGCDSTATLNLTVKNTSTSTTNATICPIQLPYVWNGLTFTALVKCAVWLPDAVKVNPFQL